MIAAWFGGIIYSLTARCLITNILHPNLQKPGCPVKAERAQHQQALHEQNNDLKTDRWL
jgi:hypothetical protein